MNLKTTYSDSPLCSPHSGGFIAFIRSSPLNPPNPLVLLAGVLGELKLGSLLLLSTSP